MPTDQERVRTTFDAMKVSMEQYEQAMQRAGQQEQDAKETTDPAVALQKIVEARETYRAEAANYARQMSRCAIALSDMAWENCDRLQEAHTAAIERHAQAEGEKAAERAREALAVSV